MIVRKDIEHTEARKKKKGDNLSFMSFYSQNDGNGKKGQCSHRTILFDPATTSDDNNAEIFRYADHTSVRLV